LVNSPYIQVPIQNREQIKKEYNEKSFEKLSMSKLQIRSFLNKLAGKDACEFRGMEWNGNAQRIINIPIKS
jgi:hypothetical protein